MTTIFATERLRLRTWAPEDLDAGLRIWGDAEVMRFIGPPLRREQVADVIRAGIDHQRQHGCQHWAMELDGTVIGCCGFNVIPDSTDLELATHVARRWWGYGYATEAVAGCAAHMRHRRLLAWTAEGNVAMQRVLEKAGFCCAGARPYWADGVPDLLYEFGNRSIASP